MLAVGTLLDNRYEILSLIGSGGMATVYKANENKLGRIVALKIMHDAFVQDAASVERFKRESQIIASLRHPNILTCFRMGFVDGSYYSCLEYFDARTLGSLLEERHKLDWKSALELIVQVCEGVNHAHSAGIVHRDITPNNVLIMTEDNETRIKVVDFGLAKNLQSQGSQSLTRTGTTVGTLYYMSPEQCLAQSVDTRADVYSIGCLLYQCLSGEPPFVTDDQKRLMLKHLEEEPDIDGLQLSSEAQSLRSVIAKCLEKSPEKRYATAGELGEDLRCILQSKNTIHASPPAKSNKAIMVLSSIICILVLALALVPMCKPRIISFVAHNFDDTATASVSQVIERLGDTDSKKQLLIELARKYKQEERDDMVACRAFAAAAEAEPTESGLYLARALKGISNAAMNQLEDPKQRQLFIDTARLVSEALNRSAVTNEKCLTEALFIAQHAEALPPDVKVSYAEYGFKAVRETKPADTVNLTQTAFNVFWSNHDIVRARQALKYAQSELSRGRQPNRLHSMLVVSAMNADAGNTSESKRLLKELVSVWNSAGRKPDDLTNAVSAYQQLAKLSAEDGDFESSQGYLSSAIEIEEKSTIAPIPLAVLQLDLAHCLSNLGRTDVANRILLNLLKTQHQEPPILKVLAELCINLKLAHEQEQLHRLCTANIKSPEALLDFENYLLQNQSSLDQRSRAAAELVLEQKPVNAPLFANQINALNNLAIIDEHANDRLSAIKNLRKSLALLDGPNMLSIKEKNQKRLDVLVWLIEIQVRVNKLDDATVSLNHLEGLVKSQADDCGAITVELARSRILDFQGRMKESDERLTRLYETSTCPDKYRILFRLAEIKFLSHHPKEAKALYAKFREAAQFEPKYRKTIREFDPVAEKL